ncbi:MAG: Uma2 family endonuclease [Chloroherpetonaceae bacterium]
MKSLLKTSTEKQYSLAEYFALERANRETKYEYLNGKIVSMAGAQPEHNSICANLIREIGNRIIKQKKPCRVYPSDQRVKSEVRASGKMGYFYPDVSVVCGKPEFADDNPKTLLNAVLVIEVLSESTFEYDFNEKRMYYAGQESIQEMLFIHYEKPSVVRVVREKDAWQISDYQSLADKIPLRSIGIELPMKEVYRDVSFPKPNKKDIKTLIR